MKEPIAFGLNSSCISQITANMSSPQKKPQQDQRPLSLFPTTNPITNKTILATSAKSNLSISVDRSTISSDLASVQVMQNNEE